MKPILKVSLFQFHKGTIKTDWSFEEQVLAHLFQFHKGTIKTADKDEWIPSKSGFQFHKGTIKTTYTYVNHHNTKISIP